MCTSMVHGMRVSGGPPTSPAEGQIDFRTLWVEAVPDRQGPLRGRGAKREQDSRDFGGVSHGGRLHGSLHNLRVS